MTNDNDGWGKPTNGWGQPVVSKGWNVAIQSMNAQQQIADTEAKLRADGFTQTGPDMWEKVHKEELVPQATNEWPQAVGAFWSIEGHQATPLSEAQEIFIGYQDAANYVILAGPYVNHAVASFYYLAVWKRFTEDKSLEMVFPLDKRDQTKLTTFEIPATLKRKGAYGVIK